MPTNEIRENVAKEVNEEIITNILEIAGFLVGGAFAMLLLSIVICTIFSKFLKFKNPFHSIDPGLVIIIIMLAIFPPFLMPVQKQAWVINGAYQETTKRISNGVNEYYGVSEFNPEPTLTCVPSNREYAVGIDDATWKNSNGDIVEGTFDIQYADDGTGCTIRLINPDGTEVEPQSALKKDNNT